MQRHCWLQSPISHRIRHGLSLNSRSHREDNQRSIEAVANEFPWMSGNELVRDLNISLNRLQRIDPSVAIAAAANSQLALKTLVKASTKDKEEPTQLACQLLNKRQNH